MHTNHQPTDPTRVSVSLSLVRPRRSFICISQCSPAQQHISHYLTSTEGAAPGSDEEGDFWYIPGWSEAPQRLKET